MRILAEGDRPADRWSRRHARRRVGWSPSGWPGRDRGGVVTSASASQSGRGAVARRGRSRGSSLRAADAGRVAEPGRRPAATRAAPDRDPGWSATRCSPCWRSSPSAWERWSLTLVYVRLTGDAATADANRTFVLLARTVRLVGSTHRVHISSSGSCHRTLQSRPIDATLSVTKAARLLGVHPNTIRAWSDAGRLRYFRINPRGDRRYRLGDLQRFLAAAETDRPTARRRREPAVGRPSQRRPGRGRPVRRRPPRQRRRTSRSPTRSTPSAITSTWRSRPR